MSNFITTVPGIFKKKWFWISFILLLIFAIIFDIVIASLVLVHSLSSGQWSTPLLVMGFLYAVGVVYQQYLPKAERKQVKWTGRLLLFIIAIITFNDYGFFKMLYFLATVFIFSRFMKWIIGFIFRKRNSYIKAHG